MYFDWYNSQRLLGCIIGIFPIIFAWFHHLLFSRHLINWLRKVQFKKCISMVEKKLIHYEEIKLDEFSLWVILNDYMDAYSTWRYVSTHFSGPHSKRVNWRRAHLVGEGESHGKTFHILSKPYTSSFHLI